MNPACPRCGGPTVALFYSRACASDCETVSSGPLAWAVWSDTDPPGTQVYLFREEDTAEVWRLLSGRQDGRTVPVRPLAPPNWYAPAWLGAEKSARVFRLRREGSEFLADPV